MSTDEHDVEWRCVCGTVNIDHDDKCNGCGTERYPEDAKIERPTIDTSCLREGAKK